VLILKHQDTCQLYTINSIFDVVSMSFLIHFLVTGERENKLQVKVKLSPYRPWRPLGLREVEAPTFSDIRLKDGGKVVGFMRWPLFTPRKIPGTHFC
jgi:hypothetical protein